MVSKWLFLSLSAKIGWNKFQLSLKVPPALDYLHASLFFLSHTGWVETALVMHTAQWNSGKSLLCRLWVTNLVETWNHIELKLFLDWGRLKVFYIHFVLVVQWESNETCSQMRFVWEWFHDSNEIALRLRFDRDQYCSIGKNNNTHTVQAESSKFASLSFDYGF